MPPDRHGTPDSIPGAQPYLTANGAIAIIGYNDMREMLEALDRLFEREHPGARFALTLKGTRTAPAALAAGRSLLAPMGAAFSPSELATYRRRVGSDPIGFAIANDSLSPRARSAPLAIFVPAANPLQRLSFAQLVRIFTAGEGPTHVGTAGRNRRPGKASCAPVWARVDHGTRSLHAQPCTLGPSLRQAIRRPP